MISYFIPKLDSVEVKPAVTRKLRRRPNDPLPAPEKRRKTSHILFNVLWEESSLAVLGNEISLLQVNQTINNNSKYDCRWTRRTIFFIHFKFQKRKINSCKYILLTQLPVSIKTHCSNPGYNVISFLSMKR